MVISEKCISSNSILQINIGINQGSLKLLDWTSGLDWRTDFFCAKNHFYASETSLSCRFSHDVF